MEDRSGQHLGASNSMGERVWTMTLAGLYCTGDVMYCNVLKIELLIYYTGAVL